MVDLLESLQAWHWMILGIILLGIEALGVGGLFVGAGVAAFITCFVALSDASWKIQLGVYFFLSVFFTFIYFKKFKHRFARQLDALQRVSSSQTGFFAQDKLLGKILVVSESDGASFVKVKAGKRVLNVRCKQLLQKGDEIRVKNCDGSTVHASKII